MNLDILGIDFLYKEKCFGIWVLSIKNYESFRRSLFTLYYAEGEWFFDLFFMKII